MNLFVRMSIKLDRSKKLDWKRKSALYCGDYN